MTTMPHQQAVEVMRKALEFYADPKTSAPGARAREALDLTANLAPSSAAEPQLCDFGNQDDFDEAHDDWERAQRYAEIGAMEYNGNTVSYMYSKAKNYGNALVECCNLIGGEGHIKDRIKALIAERDELRRTAPSSEAVAYVYESRQPHTDPVIWCEFFGRNKPNDPKWVRNVIPLYTHPAPREVQAVPEGWAIVPIVPDKKMQGILQWFDRGSPAQICAGWAKVIAAAPKVPAQEGVQT